MAVTEVAPPPERGEDADRISIGDASPDDDIEQLPVLVPNRDGIMMNSPEDAEPVPTFHAPSFLMDDELERPARRSSTILMDTPYKRNLNQMVKSARRQSQGLIKGKRRDARDDESYASSTSSEGTNKLTEEHGCPIIDGVALNLS